MRNNLRALRENRGWTQEQAARALATTRDMYVKLERGLAKKGRGLSDKWISRAAEAYGIDPGDVVTERPIEAEQPNEPAEARPTDGMVEIAQKAGMGGGAVETTEVRVAGDYADPIKDETWRFPKSFMRNEVRAPESRVIVVETQGDSMLPTIAAGDRVIVDTGHRFPSPDGIYALRDRFGGIVVKRLQSMRRGDPPMVRIISDNAYHSPEEVEAEEIERHIVGRVIFGLKRF